MPRSLTFLVGVAIFAQMFLVGQHHAQSTLAGLVRTLRPIGRSLAPPLLLVPLATLGLIALLRPPPDVTLGLAILAASPGAPLTARRAEAAMAEKTYVSALQLTLALLAVVATPATLLVFARALDVAPTAITPGAVAGQVAIVTFVPAALGYLLARCAPGFSQRHAAAFARVATALFVALMVVVLGAVIVVPGLRAMLLIGWAGSIAVLAMAALAIACGHALGGPRADRRSGLAIATVARNLGLALFIADFSPASVAAVPTILTYALGGFLLAFPYSKWIGRRSGAEQPASSPPR